MKDPTLPGKTEAETHQYLQDHGHRVAAAQAYRYLARIIETDDTYPLPPGSEAVITLAATAMQDLHARRAASLEAYANERKDAILAALAEGRGAA